MYKPKGIVEIVTWINENTSFVVNSVQRKDMGSYLFIQTEFQKRPISQNEEFKKEFKTFYGLNAAALGRPFEDCFFSIFEKLATNSNLKIDIKKELETLYEIDTLKGKKTVQFSFFTKLMHTIDTEKVIYDSKVRFLFDLETLYHIQDPSVKIKKYIEQYQFIAANYKQVLDEKQLDGVLNEFDKRFANNEISLIKKLDFIFWVAGKFWETETEYFKNKDKIKSK